MTFAPNDLRRLARTSSTFERRGRVIWAFGGVVKATGLDVSIGQGCDITDGRGGESIPAEEIGFSGEASVLMALKPLHGLSRSAEVIAGASKSTIAVGEGLLGRVVDAQGSPIDGRGPIVGSTRLRTIYADAPMPFDRASVGQAFETGVRAVDGLLTLGLGQRMGIFATAGGGKSTLLGMIARNCRCDVNVVAMVGERGREVKDFIAGGLGDAGRARSVVVVATSDRPAMERVRAANAATAIAEGFRDRGANVLLTMDSVTRVARALREVGLAMGEAPARRGFPPSVFAELPRLFERAGTAAQGSITGLYTVLLEDEADGEDPIGEEVRSILDGHIVLSRRLGEAGRYPAIDIGASVSRLFLQLTSDEHREAAARVRMWLDRFKELEFLRQIGEYKPGSDPVGDIAIARMPDLETFLRQAPDETSPASVSVACLKALAQ